MDEQNYYYDDEIYKFATEPWKSLQQIEENILIEEKGYQIILKMTEEKYKNKISSIRN